MSIARVTYHARSPTITLQLQQRLIQAAKLASDVSRDSILDAQTAVNARLAKLMDIDKDADTMLQSNLWPELHEFIKEESLRMRYADKIIKDTHSRLMKNRLGASVKHKTM